MTSAVEAVDALVADYLTFRGLHCTLKQFRQECKHNDKRDHKFKVDGITERLCSVVASSDLPSLLDLWERIGEQALVNLDQIQASHASRLENDLYKLYLVNCVQQRRPEKIKEFFDTLSPRLQTVDEWSEWFALPYIANASERDPYRRYFSKQWQETYLVSLHNFLSLVFHQIQLPPIFTLADQRNGAVVSGSREERSHTQVSEDLLRMGGGPRGEICVTGEVMDDFAAIAQSQSPMSAISSPSTRSLRSVIRKKFTGSASARKLEDAG